MYERICADLSVANARFRAGLRDPEEAENVADDVVLLRDRNEKRFGDCVVRAALLRYRDSDI